MTKKKEFIFDDSLIEDITSGRKIQTRRKQKPVIEMDIQKDDVFEIFSTSGEYIGKGLVTHKTISSIVNLSQGEYLTQGCESFLDFVSNFIKINGPIDINNEYISIINFEMVEDSQGNKLKLIKDRYGSRCYEIQTNPGRGNKS